MNNFKEIYISVDIESTGPIPGRFSMSSIGAFAAGGLTSEGNYQKFDHKNKENIFYSELKPISENFSEEAIKVGVLTGYREYLDFNKIEDCGARRHEWMKEHGQDPAIAMKEFANWCEKISEKYDARVVFTAYPASFDWTFVYWYLVNFNIRSPFGFSSVLDVKTLFMAKSKKPLIYSTKRSMPKSLFSKLPHTHRADEDAIELGILAMNILDWSGR